MKKIIIFIVTFLIMLFSIIPAFSIEVKDINNLLNSIEIGNPSYIDNLTIIPIYQTNKNKEFNFILLDEALEKNYLEISELEGDSVPHVKITNKSDKIIFLMGGEIITGCKQDRIVARDVIIGSKRKNLIVPVYCVEQGRWTYNSENFYSKKNLGTSKLRAEAQKNNINSQSEIWNEVSKNVTKNKVFSRSEAYQDIYEKKEVKDKITNIEKKLKNIENLKEGTIGVIIAVGDKVASVDIFSNEYIFKKLWPKIIKSSAFSSINDDEKNGINPNIAIKFIHNLKSNEYIKKDAIDLGEEYLLINKELNSNSIVYNNNAIHIAAFPEE